jgi:hypothetical protein
VAAGVIAAALVAPLPSRHGRAARLAAALAGSGWPPARSRGSSSA